MAYKLPPGPQLEPYLTARGFTAGHPWTVLLGTFQNEVAQKCKKMQKNANFPKSKKCKKMQKMQVALSPPPWKLEPKCIYGWPHGSRLRWQTFVDS